MMQAVLSFVTMEMLRVMRSPTHIVELIAQAILLFTLIRFGIPADTSSDLALPALLLGALSISLLHVSSCMFDEDAQFGRIAHWHYSPLSFEWILCIKFLLMLLCYALPLSIIFSGLLVMQGADSLHFVRYCTVFLCTSSAIVACGMFSAALKLLFREQHVVGMTLMLPFLTSVIIFSAPALQHSEHWLLPVVFATCFPLCTVLFSAMILRRSY